MGQNAIYYKGKSYSGGGGGGGTEVIPNPQGTATDTLNTVNIDGTIYEIISGGGAMVYSGTTTSSASLGENGDEYYRLNVSGQVIQKYIKLNTAWTNISENPTTFISKIIVENGTYYANDDNADGYDEITVNVQSGGGGSYKYLFYGEQTVSKSNWVLGTIPIDTITEKDDDYSEYLSYNSTSKEFTVLKSFTGIITAWVLNGFTSTSEAIMRLQINNVQKAIFRTSTSAGSIGGETLVNEFNVGDTIRLVNSNNQGWGFGKLKIYSVADGATNITGLSE